jgi:hypothetical protein
MTASLHRPATRSRGGATRGKDVSQPVAWNFSRRSAVFRQLDARFTDFSLFARLLERGRDSLLPLHHRDRGFVPHQSQQRWAASPWNERGPVLSHYQGKLRIVVLSTPAGAAGALAGGAA